jgi:hypothetical protein
MQEQKTTLIINDITGAATFLAFNGIEPRLVRQKDGRVVAEIDVSTEAYRLLGEFQTNPVLPIGDFLQVQRRLRGRMLDKRDERDQRENGQGGIYGHKR